MKINRKYSMILFAVLMSFVMSFAMSLTLTLINLGFVPYFFEKWIRAFAVSFLVALPTSLLIVPIARKIVDKLTSN